MRSPCLHKASPPLPAGFLILILALLSSLFAPFAQAAPPARIISLAPNLTEIVTSLGATDHLIAVTPFCKAPNNIPRIRGGVIPEIEDVLALSPDIVLTSSLTPPTIRKQLAATGTIIEFFPSDSLADIQAARSGIARILDLPAPSAPPPSTISLPPLSALLLFGTDAAFTAASGTHVDDILKAAGLRNIASHAYSPWPQLNEEAILEADPDILIIADFNNRSKKDVLTLLRSHPIRNHLSAVRNAHIIVLPADALTIPGPSVLDIPSRLRHEIAALPSGITP